MKNPVAKVGAAAVSGTTAMTAFSYKVSEEKNKQFREPELLNSLVKRLIPMHVPRAIGWAMHYSVGLLFSLIYHQIWRRTKLKPGITTGLALGAISGVIGAATWKTLLSLHPNPPRIKEKNYYLHLLLAHIVFGAFAAMGYQAPEKVQRLS